MIEATRERHSRGVNRSHLGRERELDLVQATDTRADFPRALRFATDILRGHVRGEIVVVSDGALGEASDASGEVHLGNAKLAYVKVGRDMIRAREGKLSFRLMEPMEEVVYLDQVEVLAVDHPRDFEVYPNEYFASHPPYPAFKVITSRNARPPAGAWDEHGHDVLRDLAGHRYVGDFELLPFKGFAKLHSQELDLGEPYLGGPLRLLLHGEIEYFTATGMYAADQAGVRAIAPYVEALDAKGNGVQVVGDMGFPAGLPRTMVADLTGKVPPGTSRIRIGTNLNIYWDQILVDQTADVAGIEMQAVPLAEAQLRFHGFPRQVAGNPKSDLWYVYDDVSPTGPYVHHAGNFTAYGDVRPLLDAADDRFVIIGSGDEVALEFDPSSLPALKPGWSRDYFLYADGFAKDMDFYESLSDTVEPLPFHSMPAYPYGAGTRYPMTPDYLRYRLTYNTRYISRDAVASYRARYPNTTVR